MASNSILAQMSVALTANVSDFKRGMAEAKKELRGFQRLGEEMKDFGSGMSRYLTLPMVGVAAGAIKMAADMEKASVGFTTMLGSAEKAKSMMQDLQKFAADTPFEFPEIQGAAKSLLAFGVAAEDITKNLRQIGDIASGVNAPIGEIAELFGKAKVQGRLFAEDINQLTGRGIPVIQELAKQFGVTDAEVKKLVESGKVNFGNLEKAFESLTAAGSKFGGLMEAQSETLDGIFSTAKDSIGQTLADLGKEIVEAFDLKDKLKGVIEFTQSLSNSFKNLSPETKRLIVVASGFVAVLGPLVAGIGAVVAIIPTLAAGFAVLTGPIGLVVVGLVALSAAAIKTFSSVKATSKSFEDQKKHVSNLESAFIPLVDRYDQLKAKSKLSKDEQTELNSIIAQIAKTAPDAITQFDKYGKALDISSTAARKFVETQRAIAGIKNKEKIQEQVAEFKKLDKELEKLQAKFAKGVQVEYKQVETARGVSSEKTERVLTNTEKQELGFQIKAIQDKQNALRAYVRELNGMPPLLATVGNAAEDANKKLPGLTPEQQKALNDIQAALQLASKEYQIHGDSLQYAKDKASILENGWKNLLKNGLSPQSTTVQKLKTDWQTLTKAMSDYEKRIVGMPKMDMMVVPPAVEPIQLKLLPVTEQNVTEVRDSLLEPWDQLQAQLMAITSTALTDSFVAIGDMIANAVSGGNMKAALDGFLMIILDWAGNFGKALLAAGIAASALGNLLKVGPAGAPLAIGAGIALIALSSIAKSALSKGPGFGGSGPSAGGSSTPNYNSGYDGPGGGAFGQVVFEIQGDKLRGVLDRVNYRNQRLGG